MVLLRVAVLVQMTIKIEGENVPKPISNMGHLRLPQKGAFILCQFPGMVVLVLSQCSVV